MTADIGDELSALVDTLLPGDNASPAASSVGVHGLLAERWRERHGVAGFDRLTAALEQFGGPLAGKDAASREAIVRRFEREQAELFASLRMIAYLSYYQNPAVVTAVQGLGRAYNHAPQPDGYALPPLDPADRQQAPTHARGAYVATAAVTRVDLTKLPEKPTAPEAI